MVINESGQRWVDLGEQYGLVEANQQKITLGWEMGAKGDKPQQVVLVDTNEVPKIRDQDEDYCMYESSLYRGWQAG